MAARFTGLRQANDSLAANLLLGRVRVKAVRKCTRVASGRDARSKNGSAMPARGAVVWKKSRADSFGRAWDEPVSVVDPPVVTAVPGASKAVRAEARCSSPDRAAGQHRNLVGSWRADRNAGHASSDGRDPWAFLDSWRLRCGGDALALATFAPTVADMGFWVVAHAGPSDAATAPLDGVLGVGRIGVRTLPRRCGRRESAGRVPMDLSRGI
jgi:hypothetical protein